MGGNCLKHFGIKTIRLNHTDYLELEHDVIVKCLSAGLNIYIIPFYREKFDFGDLDAVIEYNSKIDLKKVIQELFEPRVISINDGVYSFDYKNFQCDLICRKTEDLPTVINYLSWNDLGNLEGRTAHKMGLNHGWQGLRFHIRQKLFDESTENSSDHIIKTLTLSQNPREIIEFLGYDYDKRLAGFDTIEEIFIFSTSTPYFCAANFKLKSLSHQNRTRNRKRPTFMKFLKWIQENPQYDKNFDFGSKKDWIDIIDKKWPIKDEIEKERIKFSKHRESAAKFNGNKVREWTNLEGKELGKILSEFKFYRGIFSDCRTFEDYLQFNSANQIKKDFLDWYSRRTKQIYT